MDDVRLLTELARIARAEKIASDNPDWVTLEGRNGDRLHLTCPLWIDDVITSGLRLELAGPQSTPSERPYYGFKALLFATYAGKTWHLGRAEFDPEGPIGPHHRNPPDAIGFPAAVNGAHVHLFEDNRSCYGLEALSPKRDLPIAIPLDRVVKNYNDILCAVRDLFIIPDLWLEEPTWSRTLL